MFSGEGQLGLYNGITTKGVKGAAVERILGDSKKAPPSTIIIV
jgi:hypothetical protein